ncbi:retrotransposon protein, putative [Candida dubliniensis CD36]|uniref:Retrotransposon protein, putative n=1 Tax=Candida dubliniensis (strain CD36 / ATCC MYA-646 / CBS 7987 / NCPF 3949 / NRRL Y-17841) TaxID=573826 RepID=B9WAU3_CANDC|nr:retrotransposon protein, putative [Candida dubliniensis CD36]CAX43513.1 retrotransposon protein, putative [Candida dubliniensis CD36]
MCLKRENKKKKKKKKNFFSMSKRPKGLEITAQNFEDGSPKDPPSHSLPSQSQPGRLDIPSNSQMGHPVAPSSPNFVSSNLNSQNKSSQQTIGPVHDPALIPSQQSTQPEPNHAKVVDYAAFARSIHAENSKHPKYRELKRLESAHCPIDLYDLANRNNNINVPKTQLTADISPMYEFATSEQVVNTIYFTLNQARDIYQEQLSELSASFLAEIANYERDPQRYLQDHESIPKWSDDYTLDNFYESRAMSEMLHACTYFEIDNDHRLYLEAFDLTYIKKAEFEHLKQLLIDEIERLNFVVGDHSFQIQVDDKVEHMYVASFRLPSISLRSCVQYFREFLDPKDEIVHARIPVFSHEVMSMNPGYVNAYFILKLKGDKVPPKRKVILQRNYSVRILTNLSHCVYCHSKSHTRLQCPEAGECNACGQLGHRALNCESRKRRGPAAVPMNGPVKILTKPSVETSQKVSVDGQSKEHNDSAPSGFVDTIFDSDGQEIFHIDPNKSWNDIMEETEDGFIDGSQLNRQQRNLYKNKLRQIQKRKASPSPRTSSPAIDSIMVDSDLVGNDLVVSGDATQS